MAFGKWIVTFIGIFVAINRGAETHVPYFTEVAVKSESITRSFANIAVSPCRKLPKLNYPVSGNSECVVQDVDSFSKKQGAYFYLKM